MSQRSKRRKRVKRWMLRHEQRLRYRRNRQVRRVIEKLTEANRPLIEADRFYSYAGFYTSCEG